MLACTFGCDVLYEHGYITARAGGAVHVSPLAGTSACVAAYIQDTLEGRTVDWWSEDREAYYHWHRTHTFKGSAPL